MLKGKSISKELAERKRILKSPSPEDIIIKKVADAFGGARDIINDKDIRNNAARKAAIYLESVYKLPLRSHFVILAKAGIQCFQKVLDPPVKPEDDKTRVYKQTLSSTQIQRLKQWRSREDIWRDTLQRCQQSICET